MEKAEIVVVEEQHRGVAATQSEPIPTHIGDTVGQPVVFEKSVAPVAFDVDDREIVLPAQRHPCHDAAEIHVLAHSRVLSN